MRRLFLLAGCVALLIPLASPADEEVDPEPAPMPDAAIKRLDDAVNNEKIGREKVEAQRKQLVSRLEKMHASLVKRGKEKEAREMKSRLLLAETLLSGQGLDTKLTIPKLLDKASGNNRYRDLMHVIYLPSDKQGYTEYSDYGYSATPNYGGQNNLNSGYWVYVYPRWYVWKELKP